MISKILTFDEFAFEQANLRGDSSVGEMLSDDHAAIRLYFKFSTKVRDGLLKAIERSLELSELMREKKAVQYVRFGAGGGY